MTEVPAFEGPIFRPGDAGYDEEVSGFQAAYAHRPALVVGAACAEDVRRAVEYAAATGSPVAVQATGHGLSAAAGGGVLISTRRMTEVSVDPEARTARVAAGVRAGALIEAATVHGLAPLNGSSPSVGVVGYTLGGGFGLLARRYGYAAEHVLAIEIVTADGRLRRLEPGDELFGAVLGTGGNFGVVTALEVELFPITHVYGGQLVFGEPLVHRAVEAWRAWTAAGVPDELTSSVTVMRFPDIPQVPEPLRGRYVASVRIAYAGPAEEGERLVAPLRAVGERVRDDLRAMPYAESHTIHGDPDFPHPYAATNALLGELTPGALETLLPLAEPCVLDIRHLGGELRERGKGQIAVDHRDAGYAVRVITLDVARQAEIRQALAPWTVGQAMTFVYGQGVADLRSGYAPETLDRLLELKAAHDPANLFRFNRNLQAGN